MLNLPVQAIAENIAQQKFCGWKNLSQIYWCIRNCIGIIYAVYRPLQKLYNWKPFTEFQWTILLQAIYNE